jgi:hypothetical protein
MVRKVRIFVMSNWGLILVMALSLSLHLLMTWHGGKNDVWESPDANINWHFAHLIAQGQKPVFPADSSSLAEFLTPRSGVVIGGAIVPAGFIGLIYIYGLLASIFGLMTITWWTAIMSTIGVLYFYLLIKSIFGQQTAWWSAVLLTIHPAWWYYTDRGLLPNVLFVSLLLIAMYYWHQVSKRGVAISFVLASFFTSLCIIVRPSEVVWVATATIVYLLLQRRRLFWSSLFWLLLGLLPVTLLVLSHSLDMRQLILGSGYSIAQRVGENGMASIWQVLLPFGLHPRLILYVTWNFLIVLMWPFTLFTGLGYLLARRYFVENRQRYYFYGWLVLSCYLLVYYGSWTLHDNPDPTAVTIGISYVRYLLPVYIFGLPFASWLLISIGRELLPRARRAWLFAVFLGLALFSAQTAIFGGAESWWSQRQDLQTYDTVAGWVKEHVPPEAIILTERSDKYLWPAHTVLVPQGDDHYLQAGAELLEQGRIVYYARPSVSPIQLDYLQRNWQQYNLHLGPVLYDENEISIYPVELYSHDTE